MSYLPMFQKCAIGFGWTKAKNKIQIQGLAWNRIWNGPEDSTDPFISKKKSFSKLPLVDTLNLYLVKPGALQKTKNWSNHPGLRKRPKTVENWTKSNIVIFPTAPTMSAVGKEPHLFSFSSFFSRGPLLDWFGQIMLYSHWSTQT